MNSFIKHIYLLFLFTFSFCVSQAQEPSPYNFYKLNTAQGLSQSTVFSMYQDKMGFIWVGTADGLNRFDGYNFKVYRHDLNNEKSLASNEINSIIEDKDENLWIATKTAGVSILDKKTNLFDNTLGSKEKLNLNQYGVLTMAADLKGNIWLSSAKLGLFYYDFSQKILKKFVSDKLNGRTIYAIHITRHNKIVLGTDKMELIFIENFKVIEHLNVPRLSGQQKVIVSSISENKEGNLAIATTGDGLFTLNLKTKTINSIHYKPNTLNGINTIRATKYLDNGDLINVTDNSLFVVRNDNKKSIFYQAASPNKRFSLSTKGLISVLEDKNKNIWVGTWEGGINIAFKKPTVFNLIRQETGTENSPLERKITSIEATNDQLWLGTNSGLSKFDKITQKYTHYKAPRIPGNDIVSLKIDEYNNLYIASYQENLASINLENNQIKTFDFKRIWKYGNTTITTLSANKKGNLWIGTSNDGIYLLNTQTKDIEHFSVKIKNLDFGQVITYILEDSNQNLWIGTRLNGLYKINLATLVTTNYHWKSDKSNLSDNQITTIFEDQKNNIWIGTNGGGINLYNKKTNTFKYFLEKEGLPNNTIKAILEDNEGVLWLSTNLGLSKFSPLQNSFKNYTENDGLQGKEFGRNVAVKNQNGEMYFGGTNGLSFFDPQQINSVKTSIPKIIFSDFKLFNKSIDTFDDQSPIKQDISTGGFVELKHSQDAFAVEFKVLDFQILKNYQYAYKLEGFDKGWNEIGLNKTAYFTNLPEGDYNLLVKSTDNYGHWVPNQTSLKIRVLPPWYRTIWAYIVYLLIIGGALYVWRRLIHMREKLLIEAKLQRFEAQKVRELEMTKSNFFTNISHEFRTPLTLIISPIQQLIEQDFAKSTIDDIKKKHVLVLNNAQRLLRLINQILDISKLESGQYKLKTSQNDIIEFLNTIALSFKPLAENQNIKYSISINCKLRYVYFDKDIVEKIVYNLLSNAFKYSDDYAEINFEVVGNNHLLQITVQDNGIGMSDETLQRIFDRYYQAEGKKQRKTIGTGIGLALTKELIELHKGDIMVTSSLGHGSTFRVELPISKDAFEVDEFTITSTDEISPKETNWLQPTHKIANEYIELTPDKETILIVEDNDELREYLTELFKNQYNVLAANDGTVGLALAKEQIPNLILSDFMMPEMNGDILCAHIKQDELTCHIPVIILTSRQHNDIVNNSFDSGADDYILKPFNSNTLKKKIDNILKTRRLYIEKHNILKENNQKNDEILNESDRAFNKRITEIINANLNKADFDVETLENELKMSKMQLYRKAKAVANVGPNELIRHFRMQKAKKLIKEGKLNVSEVSYAVGIEDPSYFARIFKKEFGKSPTEFKN